VKSSERKFALIGFMVVELVLAGCIVDLHFHACLFLHDGPQAPVLKLHISPGKPGGRDGGVDIGKEVGDVRLGYLKIIRLAFVDHIRGADEAESPPWDDKEVPACLCLEDYGMILVKRSRDDVDTLGAYKTMVLFPPYLTQEQVRPRAGGIHRNRGLYFDFLSTDKIHHPRPFYALAFSDEVFGQRIVDNIGPVFRSREDRLQREPFGAVHLAVIVNDSALELGRVEDGLQGMDLLGRKGLVSGDLLIVVIDPFTVIGERVIEDHGRHGSRHAPHAPAIAREDKRKGVDKVRRDDLHDPAFLERFPHETHLEGLQIAQPAVDELGGGS